MADDIVARLREPASSHGLHVFDPTHETRKVAADEIERLRALASDNLGFAERHMHAKHAALDEIERLRAALVYVSVVSEPHRHAPTYTAEHLHGVIGAMKTCACAALAGEKQS